MPELVIRKIADHFARQGGGGGVMGWVIRDPRIIWWGARGGVLDPRGSVIRGPPTTHNVPASNKQFGLLLNEVNLLAILRPLRDITPAVKNQLWHLMHINLRLVASRGSLHQRLQPHVS